MPYSLRGRTRRASASSARARRVGAGAGAAARGGAWAYHVIMVAARRVEPRTGAGCAATDASPQSKDAGSVLGGSARGARAHPCIHSEVSACGGRAAP